VPHQSQSDKPSVMVVEDFDDTRQLIAAELRKEGYEVVEVSYGREAVEAVKRRCPDLVLLDLSLPRCDGLSAAFRMREVGAMCHVPIVACTAHDAALHRGAALAAGCDDYLTKPLDMGRLRGVVGRLLAERSDRVRRGEAEARAERITSARLDDEGLRDYLDGLMGRAGAPE
jgi:two-component system, cell cycle response regulator DivK